MQKHLCKNFSKAKTAQVSYNNGIIKNLAIWSFINKYNHNTNYIDRVNYLCCFYNKHFEFY